MMHDVTIKGWPTCGQMHSALDCASALAAEAALVPDDMTSVVVEVPQSCIAIASGIAPRDVGAAKFATSFCVAATLCGKPPTFTRFHRALSERAAGARDRQLQGRADAQPRTHRKAR
jgi:2-methylcitrate dehydratase PrpD